MKKYLMFYNIIWVKTQERQNFIINNLRVEEDIVDKSNIN